MNRQPIASTLFNMVAAMVIVAVLAGSLLGTSYLITKEPIQKAKDQRSLQAIKEVVNGEFDNNPYLDKIVIPKSEIELYPARQGSKVTSVAIKTYSNNAFSGKIELIVGFFLDGTINGYKVISQKETPGLGTKVTENKFSSQFHGLNPGDRHFKVKQDGGEIDAVTSATISSRAVIDAIQRAHRIYSKFNTNSAGEQNE